MKNNLNEVTMFVKQTTLSIVVLATTVLLHVRDNSDSVYCTIDTKLVYL